MLLFFFSFNSMLPYDPVSAKLPNEFYICSFKNLTLSLPSLHSSCKI